MPWFMIDDGFWSHPKTVGLSDKAFRLWVRAGAYCAQHLTDGIVTRNTLAILGAKTKEADELWVAGLWDRVPDDGGYRFHDWHEYQKSASWWRDKREKDRARQQKRRGNAARNPTTGEYAKKASEPTDYDEYEF
jgi:hypothetical protein